MKWPFHRHRFGWFYLHIVGYGRLDVWACERCGWMCKRDRDYLGRMFVNVEWKPFQEPTYPMIVAKAEVHHCGRLAIHEPHEYRDTVVVNRYCPGASQEKGTIKDD